VLTIVRNQFYSDKRRSWRQMDWDQELAERTLPAVDNQEQVVALDELRRGLAELPEDQREALILVGAGGYSYDEAAGDLRVRDWHREKPGLQGASGSGRAS
jgi:RNA polymerase sigma-70 factor (ECF subfamily)